jgi:hypothetical protein
MLPGRMRRAASNRGGGAIGGALFLQVVFGHVGAGGNYPIAAAEGGALPL